MNKKSSEDFIFKSSVIHNNKYDYSKVNYILSHSKVCIICPEHGEFWQTPHMHLRGQGCPHCGGHLRKTLDEFINESNFVHNNKYDYSKVHYINAESKVCIICPEHGEFYQKPIKHLKGQGCPKCSGRYKSSEEFVIKAKEIHGDRYDYSKINYVRSHKKVCIICPEHGEFWMTPHNHISGKQGCPYCKQSKMENEIHTNFPEFIQQKQFKDWLLNTKTNRCLFLDFYIPEKNIVIECQGIQHFKPLKVFNGDNGFNDCIYRDNLKYNLCKEHNIDIIYYFPKSYLKYNIDFYKDKKCFHNLNDLRKYLLSLD